MTASIFLQVTCRETSAFFVQVYVLFWEHFSSSLRGFVVKNQTQHNQKDGNETEAHLTKKT